MLAARSKLNHTRATPELPLQTNPSGDIMRTSSLIVAFQHPISFGDINSKQTL
jgi:hypothetical protein